jgi:hypothetical protein
MVVGMLYVQGRVMLAEAKKLLVRELGQVQPYKQQPVIKVGKSHR